MSSTATASSIVQLLAKDCGTLQAQRSQEERAASIVPMHSQFLNVKAQAQARLGTLSEEILDVKPATKASPISKASPQDRKQLTNGSDSGLYSASPYSCKMLGEGNAKLLLGRISSRLFTARFLTFKTCNEYPTH